MRTSLYLVGFAAASMMLGAGAIGFGCSSSSSNTTPTDSGTPETGTPEDSGGDGGVEDAAEEAEAAVMCTPSGVNVETFDSGSSSWACYQAMCTPSLTACAADCTCDNAILGALLCAADAGASGTMACFVTAFGNLGSNAAGAMVEGCLVGSAMTACGGTSTPDAGDAGHADGGDAAAPTDSGSPTDAADGGG